MSENNISEIAADRLTTSKVETEEKVLPPVTPSTEAKEYNEAAKDFVVGEPRSTTTVYYGLGGKEVKESDPYFAKKVTNTVGEESRTNYYVAIYNGSLYNPAGPFSRRNQNLKEFFTYQRCNEEPFNTYVSYLDNKVESYYWRANRGIING